MILLSAIYFYLTSVFGVGNVTQTQVDQMSGTAQRQGYTVVNDANTVLQPGTYDSRITTTNNGVIVVTDQSLVY